jgi:hypothetical protein
MLYEVRMTSMSHESQTFLLNPRHVDFAAGRTRWLPMSDQILMLIVLLSFGAAGAIMAWSVHPAAYFERYGFVRAVPQILGLILGAALVILPCAAAPALINEMRRLVKLSRHGKIISGELLERERISGNEDNETRVRIRYAFQSPAGKRITRSENVRWPDTTDVPLPAPGTRLQILYLAEDNFLAL